MQQKPSGPNTPFTTLLSQYQYAKYPNKIYPPHQPTFQASFLDLTKPNLVENKIIEFTIKYI